MVSRRLALLALALSFTSSIAVLGSPIARAAEPADRVARVGFVGTESLSRGVTAFWERLHKLGWVEGKNLTIEARWAEGQVERLPALMNQVIAQNVDVLFTYGTPAAVAAKKATSTVPIVAAMMGDPVGTGLAASLARPGGNLTGISLAFAEGFGGKWLQLLHETVPRLSTVAVIGNPASPWVLKIRTELEGAARTRGLALRFIEVRDVEGLDQAFARAQREAQGAIVLGDPLTLHNWQRILSLAAKHRVPSMYTNPESAEFGGLMAYGADSVVMFRRAAEYVDKILRGAKPGDLPIEQPTQYTLAANLKTAKTLGLKIPESILIRADEVIR
jgi:putative ABC transport system substrate-binding protein